MQVYGRSNISEFLGERIVYRNLIPMDDRLLSLIEIRKELGLSSSVIPRKSEKDYAKVIVQMLNQARAIELPVLKIERLILIGDTRLNDGMAFENICQAGDWPGIAFIGAESDEPLNIEIVQVANNRRLFLANRWSALSEFDRYCNDEGFPIDDQTAIILDLDKTTLGARGRNAHVIDQARVQAVEDTVATLLGTDFDKSAFEYNYSTLNHTKFHPFTTDNQDYLAYICLILGSGLYDLESLVNEVNNGSMRTFNQFINQVDAQIDQFQSELVSIHEEIFAYVQVGDPTPFKAFRRNEYLRTVNQMGQMEDLLPANLYLEGEIVITQEVRSTGLAWRRCGALLFGLSDKPDEASIPSEELKKQGFLPLHQKITHSVGSI
jgi:DNA-binding transcriptional MerR regulator